MFLIRHKKAQHLVSCILSYFSVFGSLSISFSLSLTLSLCSSFCVCMLFIIPSCWGTDQGYVYRCGNDSISSHDRIMDTMMDDVFSFSFHCFLSDGLSQINVILFLLIVGFCSESFFSLLFLRSSSAHATASNTWLLNFLVSFMLPHWWSWLFSFLDQW